MAEREKVIKGLEICTKDIPMSNAVHKDDFCKECPYYNAKYRYCWNQIVMMRDALALLKEQPEIVRCRDCKWHEMQGEMLLCKAQDKPHTYDWYCADGRKKDDGE